MPLTFPMIISFQVIFISTWLSLFLWLSPSRSYPRPITQKVKHHTFQEEFFGKLSQRGPISYGRALLNYLTCYSQHPLSLPILMTGDLLHNPWGQSSFLCPLNPELCPNSRACNCLHSFLSTFTSFFGCLPSPSLPHTRTLGPWLFPSLGSALAFLHSIGAIRERTLKWEKLDLNSGCYPFPPSVLGLFYIAGLKMLGNS